AATLNTAGCTLSGVVAGDSVTCSGATGVFANKNAATGKTVTVTGITLTGAAAGNYTLTSGSATTTADITPKALSVAAQNKVMKQGDIVPGASTVFSGLIAGDNVTATFVLCCGITTSSAAGQYDDAYQLSGSVGGTDVGNYSPITVNNGKTSMVF